MAKDVKEKQDSSKSTMEAFFKENKNVIYNQAKPVNYKVSSGSLRWDTYIDGGIEPGIIRFAGPYEAGKTSCTLTFMGNFFRDTDIPFRKKGIFIKAEGRLSDNIKSKYDFKFVDNTDEWEDNTCLVISCNRFETVLDGIKNQIMNNLDDIKYFIILDSVDCLVSEDDYKRKSGESVRVAGGAVLMSVFVKQLALEIKTFGHIFAPISQVRAEIRLMGQAGPMKDSFSGGNALLHAADWIFELKNVTKTDKFVKYKSKPEKDDKFEGHNVSVTIHKSTNRTTDQKFSYPVLYDTAKGFPVWTAQEASEMLVGWDLIKAGGAWCKTSDFLRKELEEYGVSVPEQFNGANSIIKFVEENPKIIDYVKSKLALLK